MRVLLVYPEFPDTFWSFKHALKFISKKSSGPPLGLLTVAAMLPGDWDLRLVDLAVRPLMDEDLAWADYAFISAMAIQCESAIDVVARCNAAGVKTVAGGPLFTHAYEDFTDVDHFVLNEAELTLPPFLNDLACGEPKRLYASTEYPDLSLTPPPRWDLLDMNQYASVYIQYSRGCPFNCDFCNVTALLGHTPRTKSAEQVIRELQSLYDAGWRSGQLFFVDDNFIGNKKKLKQEILPAIMEWREDKKSVSFMTEVSINIADDDELLDLMVQAGFSSVFVGIETPNDESLAECGKGQNRGRNLIENVRNIQRRGMQVAGGFIIGFDSDPLSIFEQQIQFIQQSGIVTAMVGLLQAPPGTQLYARLKEEGRLLGNATGDNCDNTMNFVPKMNWDTLQDGYRRVLAEIYSPKGYYARVKTMLEDFNPSPAVKSPLSFEYIKAFFKSIYLIGIKSADRMHYWRLFFWTLLRRPRLFPLAITMSVYGYHFRRVYNLNVLKTHEQGAES
jgi:radical SAM superfamily enzyme YgiQ (UPF0313 family)